VFEVKQNNTEEECGGGRASSTGRVQNQKGSRPSARLNQKTSFGAAAAARNSSATLDKKLAPPARE